MNQDEPILTEAQIETIVSKVSEVAGRQIKPLESWYIRLGQRVHRVHYYPWWYRYLGKLVRRVVK